VERYRRRNPYFHYFVAQVFFDEGHLSEARLFLDNAIRLKRDEPQFYEALALVATAEGDSVASGRYLARAERYREAKPLSPPERIMSSRLMVRKNM
jgi:predicted Zn-dependent protease